jgi:hypothetical protein
MRRSESIDALVAEFRDLVERMAPGDDTTFPIWLRLTAEDVEAAARTALAISTYKKRDDAS